MAEPRAADPDRPGETPRLVSVAASEGGAGPAAAASAARGRERAGVPRAWFALVAALLVLALLGLWAQTRRASAQAEQIAALGGQIEGLEVQLSAAQTQIATYDMQLSLIEVSVERMYEEMGNLLALVGGAPPALGEAGAPDEATLPEAEALPTQE